MAHQDPLGDDQDGFGHVVLGINWEEPPGGKSAVPIGGDLDNALLIRRVKEILGGGPRHASQRVVFVRAPGPEFVSGLGGISLLHRQHPVGPGGHHDEKMRPREDFIISVPLHTWEVDPRFIVPAKSVAQGTPGVIRR